MRSLLYCLVVLPATFAAPAKVPRAEGPIKDQWIVKLQQGASSEDLQSVIDSVAPRFGVDPTHVYDYDGFRGFSIRGSVAVSTAIDNDDSVVFVEQGKVVTANTLTTQRDPPYGLPVKAPTHTSLTPVSMQSTPIFEGRAIFGANFADDDDRDGNGHGTHALAPLAGRHGVGSLSGVIAGLEWAVQDAKNNSRTNKSVANLSLSSGYSPIANAAVAAAVNQGLFCAVAAGNEGSPIKKVSPASEPKACTMAAIDGNDVRPNFSNYGQLVDVFALGVFVESAWINEPDSTAVLSGTSMATPHVAGLGAYLLGLGYGPPGGNPLCTSIKKISTKGAVQCQPKFE